MSLQASAEQLRFKIGLPCTFKNGPWNKLKKYPYIDIVHRPIIFLRREWDITPWLIKTTTTTKRTGYFPMLCFLLT